VNITEFAARVSLIGIDSVALIYLIEQNKTYYDRMYAIAQHIADGSIQAVCSTITLAEVLVHPLRTGNTQLVNQYENILRGSKNLSLIALNHDIARLSADLRARYNLRTPDAIHVASAIHSGCDAFLTNDGGIRRVNEINVVMLDELQIRNGGEES